MRVRPLPAAALGVILGAIRATAEEPLVTPTRVGRADAPLVLSVWAQQEYSHLAARTDVAAIFRDIFEEWAEAHPDVRLDLSVMPALELHKAKLLLAAAAGRLPDVASIDSFWMPLFLAGGHVQPLNDLWPAEDRADFLPFTIDTLSDASGNVYGLWHGTDCRVLYYRKDLVPTPPRTWDELIDVASRLSRERNMAGYLYNAGRWEAAVFDHLPMFWGQGGELVDAAGRPVFGEAPHREKMLRLLAFLRRTIESGASPRSVLANNDYQQLSTAAVAGDVAMFLGGSWQLRELETNLSPAEYAKWDVAPVPQAEAGIVSTGTGGWVWVTYSRDPARRKAAVELIRTIESPENVARLSQPMHQLPVRRSVYRDAPFFREDGFHARFGELLGHARARPAVPLYPAISEQLQLAIGSVVAGDKSPERALDDAWRAVQTIAARPVASIKSAPWASRAVAVLPLLLTAILVVMALLPVAGRGLVPWLFPTLLAVGAFILYPMLDLLRLSFTDTRTHGAGYRYTLESFQALGSDPDFPGMVGVTLAFVAASVVLQVAIGLALAVLIDSARRRRAPGTLLARVAVVGAWVIPGVLVGVLWRILLVENRAGISNYALSFFDLGPLPFLSAGGWALASVVVANVWRGCAFSMILQYAGLQRIPRELHEAADLEGISAGGRLRLVILPQIAPVLALNVALATIATLNTFDMILPLTGGGPARRTEVISLYMYRSAFFSLEAGRAAAVAMVMLLLNVGLALVAARLTQRERGTP